MGQAIALTLNFMELDGSKPDRKHKGGNDRRETVDFSLDSLIAQNPRRCTWRVITGGFKTIGKDHF